MMNDLSKIDTPIGRIEAIYEEFCDVLAGATSKEADPLFTMLAGLRSMARQGYHPLAIEAIVAEAATNYGIL